MALDMVLAGDRLGSVARIADLSVPVVREFERLDRPTEMHDRLIVATARVLSAALITGDTEIRTSGRIATIW